MTPFCTQPSRELFLWRNLDPWQTVCGIPGWSLWQEKGGENDSAKEAAEGLSPWEPQCRLAFFQWAIKTEGGKGKGRGSHQINKLEFSSAVAVQSPPGAAMSRRSWGQAAGFSIPALPLARLCGLGRHSVTTPVSSL